MSLLSIILPTVVGREAYLAKALASYEGRTRLRTEIILMEHQPTCGRAWNLGAEKATGDFLHFAADDVEPHEGWDTAAVEVNDRGGVPAPMFYNAAGELYWADGPIDGTPLVDWAPSREGTYAPFCSAAQYEQIGPTIDAHYGTDDFFAWRAKYKCGFPILLRTAYAFTHHFAPAGRGAGMDEGDRHLHDEQILNAAVEREGGRPHPLWA